MRPALAPALLLSLALLSCAKERARAPVAAEGTIPSMQVLPMASLAEAVKASSENELSCADPASCPEGTGMLLAADTEGGFLPGSAALAACSAFLVSEELALTNSHCIPPSVKAEPALCGERVRLLLPTATGSESFSCKELLGFSERATAYSPDLALLRLSRPSGRSGLRLSRQGVPAETTLVFHKVTPDLERRRGTLSRERCVSVAGSYRMPLYRSEKDPVFVFSGCSSEEGNSGGPLLNEAGEVLGLAQAKLEISESAHALWSPQLAEAGGFAALALGTSLGCLLENPPAWSWNPACGTIEELQVAEARPRLRSFLPELEPRARELLAPFKAQASGLRWKREALPGSALLRRERLVPECREANSASSPDGSELQLPELVLELRFNRYLQLLPPRAGIAGVATERVKLAELSACLP